MATKKTTKATSATVSAPVYAATGKSAGTIELSGVVFARPWNADLVHQVVTGMQANARAGLAHTKFRGEVSGSGKKPWQQKGTGRARHGSTRSPIWRSGGITHGPRSEKDYSVKINKKQKTAALFATLTKKLTDGRILFSEALSFDTAKTKEAEKVLKNLATVSGFETINTEKKNNILIVLPTVSETTRSSFRNLPHVTLIEARNINPVDVMKYRYVIISNPADTQALLLQKRGVKKSA